MSPVQKSTSLASVAAEANLAELLDADEVSTFLSESGIRAFQQAANINRDRYARAFASDNGLKIDSIKHFDGISESTKFTKLIGEETHHSNGAEKRYTLITFSNGYTAEINELNNCNRYVIQLKDAEGNLQADKSGKITKARLEHLVEKHFDIAATEDEKIERFKKMVQSMQMQDLFPLREKYLKLSADPAAGLSAVDSVPTEEKINAMKLSLITEHMKVLAPGYIMLKAQDSKLTRQFRVDWATEKIADTDFITRQFCRFYLLLDKATDLVRHLPKFDKRLDIKEFDRILKLANKTNSPLDIVYRLEKARENLEKKRAGINPINR